MTDTLSLTGWIVLDEKEKSNIWANVLCIFEAPIILKISQKQYTFIMHLVDELSLFLDILERNKIQIDLTKQKSPLNNSSNNPKITICLTTSSTFTLAVIDNLEDEIVNLSIPPRLSLPEVVETEPVIRDTSNVNTAIDLVTTPVPIAASTVKVGSPINNKNLKKSKVEENIQRGLESNSKGSRSPSSSLSTNMSDIDETGSQFDFAEDLDADLDASLFINDSEQQQKATRIELDDDCISLTGKNYTATTSESVGFISK
jgi:hypothetical protein